MDFSEKLKRLRNCSSLTQQELADAVGITKRTVIYYENGERQPRTDDIYERIAEYFNVPADFLKTDNGDEDFEAAAEYAYGSGGRIQADKLVREISGLFAGGKLSENDRDAVMLALQEAYWKVKEKKI